MCRRGRLPAAALILGVFVVVEPPLTSDSSGRKSHADTKAPAVEWRQAFPQRFDSRGECEAWRRASAPGRSLKCVAAPAGSLANYHDHAGRRPPKTQLPSERLRSDD